MNIRLRFGALFTLAFLASLALSVIHPSEVSAQDVHDSEAFEAFKSSDFAHLYKVDGDWIDFNGIDDLSEQFKVMQAAEEQWIRGRLDRDDTIPECPLNWFIRDASGAEYTDSRFGTWGSPSGSTTRLLGYRGKLVEVHLMKDMRCMNEPASIRHWRLEALDCNDPSGCKTVAFFPIALSDHTFDRARATSTPLPSSTPVPSATPTLVVVGDEFGYVVTADERDCAHAWLISCKGTGRHPMRHPDGPSFFEPYIGQQVAMGGIVTSRCEPITYEKVNLSLTTECGSTPTPRPSITPTPGSVFEPYGHVYKPEDPRACEHAIFVSCYTGDVYSLRHEDGPAYFESYFGRLVQIYGPTSLVCGKAGFMSPSFEYRLDCGGTITPTPPRPTMTPGPTPTPLFTEVMDINVITDTSGPCGGNARFVSAETCRTLGWITNAPSSWGGWTVTSEFEVRTCPHSPSLLQLTWTGASVTLEDPFLCAGGTDWFAGFVQFIVFDPGDDFDVYLFDECMNFLGRVKNISRDEAMRWNNDWITFRGSRVITTGSDVHFYWDGTEPIFGIKPACESTPTPGPSATSSWTPVPSSTPVPSATPRPTDPSPEDWTAYFFPVHEDDWDSELIKDANAIAIDCEGTIIIVRNVPEFKPGQLYDFRFSVVERRSHKLALEDAMDLSKQLSEMGKSFDIDELMQEHEHLVIDVIGSMAENTVGCTFGEVDVPDWKECGSGVCWRYKILELPGREPEIILIPYPDPDFPLEDGQPIAR